MNPPKLVFLVSFLIIVFIVADVQPIFVDRDKKMLTAAEIKKNIQLKYPGKIGDIKLSKIKGNQIYMIDLENQNQTYVLKIDAYSGRILYLIPLKKGTSKNSVTLENEEVASSAEEKEDEKPAKRKTPLMVISLDRAKEIALSKIKGKFNSIHLEDKNGSFVYEIEVETTKKEQIDIEINAYTGEVLSISWDD